MVLDWQVLHLSVALHGQHPHRIAAAMRGRDSGLRPADY